MSKPHCWKGQGLVIDVKGSNGRREILALDMLLANLAFPDQVGCVSEYCGPVVSLS